MKITYLISKTEAAVSYQTIIKAGYGRKTQIRNRERNRLWEMSGDGACSILGTCLTLSDLNALKRKLRLKVKNGFPHDYQLHVYFVKEASKHGRAAKLLNKLLDKKYAKAIREVRNMTTEQELVTFWNNSRKVGNIPGPYWAILSHPSSTTEINEILFADVHMLSHLVGASNQANIRQLPLLEEKCAVLEKKFAKQYRRNHHNLNSKNNEIKQIRADLNEMKLEKIWKEKANDTVISCDQAAKSAALQDALYRQKRKTDDINAANHKQQQQIDQLNKLVQSLREEITSLENVLIEQEQGNQTSYNVDLRGRNLLYVGGRQTVINRIRPLVHSWNGQLLHHDGGVEMSMSELAGAVSKADSVVFPTDCVSHKATLTVKRLCRQSMKPYVPLRTSGVASFVFGLCSVDLT